MLLRHKLSKRKEYAMTYEYLPIRDPMQEYESMLEAEYPDLSDDWDMYEDMSTLRRSFETGASAAEMFQNRHGRVVGTDIARARSANNLADGAV